jgi:hypothetical protein
MTLPWNPAWIDRRAENAGQLQLNLLVTLVDKVSDVQKGVGTLLRREPAPAANVQPVTESEAARVIGLVKILEAGKQRGKAPLARVFWLLVMDRLQQKQAAVACKCRHEFINRRARQLERHFGYSIPQLQAMNSRFAELRSVEHEHAERIYRGGLDD